MSRKPSTGRRQGVHGPALRAALAAMAIGLLGACTYPQYPFHTDARSAPTMDPYRVDTIRINHDIVFLPGSATLDPIAQANLRSFISQIGVTSNDALTVVASGPFALARENAVANTLANMGIRSLSMAEGNVGFDQVTVSVSRTHYLATACLRGGIEHFNEGVLTPPPGCATATNLANMVENPNDLLTGRTAGPTDGVTAVRAVTRYRAGNTASLAPFSL